MASSGYVSVFARASRPVDEDSVSILSPAERTTSEETLSPPDSPPDRQKSSSDDAMSRHTPSWLASPIKPQESILHEQDRSSSPTLAMGHSVFGSYASSERAYQEQVAWANSTQFRSAPPPEPEPHMVQTTFLNTSDDSSTPSRKYFRHPRRMLEPWITGVWIRFPWLGFGTLFLILLFTGASAGILLASNNTSPEDWKIGRDNAQPHVYVSVFEMVMNFLILFALADGVVIRFWRQLLHGTTLESIHDTYESIHLWPSLRKIAQLRFNIVAVACILASVSFARGPLFQRALTLAEEDRKGFGGVVYRTSPLFVSLGTAVSLIGVAAVLPLYYGFWEMGRKVSLDPLEVARAFGAPMMEGLDGNTTPYMIAVERGGMSVKYGALDRYGEEKKLRVEESARATVRTPWQGEVFG